MDDKMSMIRRHEEHDWQFSSRDRAAIAARLETQATGRKHQVFLTTTYRNMQPRACWYVCLALVWHRGNLVSA